MELNIKIIEAIICVAFTNEVPKTVKELDLMSEGAFHENNGLAELILKEGMRILKMD